MSDTKKEMARERQRRYRARHRERLLEQKRQYYAANRDAERERNRRWRAENPEKALGIERRKYAKSVERHRADRLSDPLKYRARDALSNAIRAGKIVRPNACSECGATCTPHGHHHDYDQPLSVTWLCQPCHVKAHWPAERSD